MSSGWMKSLQCKSKALDDVVQQNTSLKSKNPNNNSSKRHHHHRSLLSHSHRSYSSCKNSVQSLKDITTVDQPTTKQSKSWSNKPKPTDHISPPIKLIFPSLTELLPEGHPSRNVVEIIFHTSWGDRKSFNGQIDMVFKVHNPARTLTRFEEYREMVKARTSTTDEDHARCVADGNEVMRFYCLGPNPDGAWGGAWGGGKGAGLCTVYSGSGCAHENAGGGRGRRAMLVCRVIAGRVRGLGLDSSRVNGYDSASGDNGEMLVFDSRALLPCFLIIYKL